MKTAKKPFTLYPGRHSATFLGIEEQMLEYGPCLLWRFLINYGLKATIVTRITGIQATPGSTCGMFIRNMLGRPWMEDDLRSIISLFGSSFTVLVRYHNGYPRVEDVSR
jgi:hypothetical protein